MKKFETQVCQYVIDLIRDQRNTELSRSAKKAIEVMQASLRPHRAIPLEDKLSTLVVDGSRQGKFSFGHDGYIVNLASYFSKAGRVEEAYFIGCWLREFFLTEWIYDSSSAALHNELWELLFWGMKDLYKWISVDKVTRDKPHYSEGVLHYEGLSSSNLLSLWSVWTISAYVKRRFKMIYQRYPLVVQEAFWEDPRGMWVLYRHLNTFRLPTISETDEFVKRSFRKMSAFVSVLETISNIGGGV